MTIITDWSQFGSEHRSLSSSTIRHSDELIAPANGQMAMTRADDSRDVASGRFVKYQGVDFARRSSEYEAHRIHGGSVQAHQMDMFLDWQYIPSIMQEPKYVFGGHNMLNAKELKAYGFQYESIGKMSKL